MKPTASRLVFPFFLWVFVFSLPFYALAALEPQLKTWMPLGLPINVLMVLCPTGVALWLTFQEAGSAGVRHLLGRTLDAQVIRPKVWLLLSLALMPLVMLVSYVTQRFLGQSLSVFYPLVGAVLLTFAVYFVGAIWEEVGWMGYAINPLLHRYGFWAASIGLGLVWWLWHVVPYYLMGRSTEWIVWQGLATVMFRILMVWMYNHAGGSVLTSILFHTMINTSIDLFPGGNTHYDPRVTGLILTVIAPLVAWCWPSRGLDT